MINALIMILTVPRVKLISDFVSRFVLMVGQEVAIQW